MYCCVLHDKNSTIYRFERNIQYKGKVAELLQDNKILKYNNTARYAFVKMSAKCSDGTMLRW